MSTKQIISLRLLGPCELNYQNIDDLIRGRSPGNYALGRIQGNAFIVKFIGRSDKDLNKKLKEWVGKYSHFKWCYASSEKEAFEKECTNYHVFGGLETLDNYNHPDKPDEKNWKCPVCGV